MLWESGPRLVFLERIVNWGLRPIARFDAPLPSTVWVCSAGWKTNLPGPSNQLAVGSNAKIKKLKVAITMVTDLRDRTLTLGIIDTHIHAIRAAQGFTLETC